MDVVFILIIIGLFVSTCWLVAGIARLAGAE